MGFKRSKCESDIWYRDKGDHNEYLSTYVDELAIYSKDCQAILEALQSAPYNFKLKGTSVIDKAVHLRSAFSVEMDKSSNNYSVLDKIVCV